MDTHLRLRALSPLTGQVAPSWLLDVILHTRLGGLVAAPGSLALPTATPTAGAAPSALATTATAATIATAATPPGSFGPSVAGAALARRASNRPKILAGLALLALAKQPHEE